MTPHDYTGGSWSPYIVGALIGGWYCFAGDQSEDYTIDPSRLGMYDVNTIRNYDPANVPLLDDSPRTAFIRDADTGPLRLIVP